MKETKLTCKIMGLRPLILHNGRTQNPLDPYAKKLKELNKKRGKTDEDHLAIAAVEWEASLYWSDDIGLYMPAANIQSMLWEGAKKIKRGRDILAAQVLEDAPIEMDGHDDLEKLRANEETWFTKPVRIQKAFVLKTRFMAPAGWRITFEVRLDIELMDPDDFRQILGICGERVGLGVWSPREPKPGTFGLFQVESIR